MEKANTDTTYCTYEKCREKCWRYVVNYKFEEDKNYWFMPICEEELSRR